MECVFQSSPLVSSVVFSLLLISLTLGHYQKRRGRECCTCSHLPQWYHLHSFRVYFNIFSTRFECIFTSSPLVSSVFSHLLHSFRVYFSYHILRHSLLCTPKELVCGHFLDIQGHLFSTRFECNFTSSPLVSSVVLHLFHSFRV